MAWRGHNDPLVEWKLMERKLHSHSLWLLLNYFMHRMGWGVPEVPGNSNGWGMPREPLPSRPCTQRTFSPKILRPHSAVALSAPVVLKETIPWRTRKRDKVGYGEVEHTAFYDFDFVHSCTDSRNSHSLSSCAVLNTEKLLLFSHWVVSDSLWPHGLQASLTFTIRVCSHSWTLLKRAVILPKWHRYFGEGGGH